MQPDDRRLDRFSPFGIFAVFTWIYGSTTFPSVAGGDSGELAAIACTGGVAPSPGYPLYTLLSRLFLFLPWGTPAWKLGFLSAACTAGTVTLLYLLAQQLFRNRSASLATTLVFALSPIVWEQSNQPSVLPLHALLCLAFFWFFLQRVRSADKPLALITGLGCAHHPLFLLWAAPLTAWRLYRFPPSWRDWWSGYLIGISPYVLLFWWGSRATFPGTLWGETATWRGFWRHLLNLENGFAGAYSDLSSIPESTWSYGWTLLVAESKTVGAGGLLLVLVGVVVGIRNPRTRFLTWTSLALYATFHAFLRIVEAPSLGSALQRTILTSSWIQTEALLALGFGAGTLVLARIPGRVWFTYFPRFMVAGWCLVGVPRYLRFDQSRNFEFLRHGTALLETLPENAVLLVQGELNTATTHYLQGCERMRTDVRVVDSSQIGRRTYRLQWAEHLSPPRFPEGSSDISQFVDVNRYSAVFATASPKETTVRLGEPLSTPHGLHVRLTGATEKSAGDWTTPLRALFAFEPRWNPQATGTWEEISDRAYADAYVRACASQFQTAMRTEPPLRIRLLREISVVLEKVLEHPDRVHPMAFKLAATIAMKQGETNRSDFWWRRYLAVAPKQDPDLAEILSTVRSLSSSTERDVTHK